MNLLGFDHHLLDRLPNINKNSHGFPSEFSHHSNLPTNQTNTNQLIKTEPSTDQQTTAANLSELLFRLSPSLAENMIPKESQNSTSQDALKLAQLKLATELNNSLMPILESQRTGSEFRLNKNSRLFQPQSTNPTNHSTSDDSLVNSVLEQCFTKSMKMTNNRALSDYSIEALLNLKSSTSNHHHFNHQSNSLTGDQPLNLTVKSENNNSQLNTTSLFQTTNAFNQLLPNLYSTIDQQQQTTPTNLQTNYHQLLFNPNNSLLREMQLLKLTKKSSSSPISCSPSLSPTSSSSDPLSVFMNNNGFTNSNLSNSNQENSINKSFDIKSFHQQQQQKQNQDQKSNQQDINDNGFNLLDLNMIGMANRQFNTLTTLKQFLETKHTINETDLLNNNHQKINQFKPSNRKYGSDKFNNNNINRFKCNECGKSYR